MSRDIQQLFPPDPEPRDLQGLYLAQNIQACRGHQGVFIFANFITSIDGRIAVPVAGKHSHQVPPAIGNARDWRLYQELAAQADLLITSARYFRQAEQHEAQDTLPVGMDPAFDDLRQWRLEQGLKAQPDIAIFSASLNIPVHALRPYQERNVTIFTGRQSSAEQREKLRSETHADIRLCGDGHGVDGQVLRAALGELGYEHVYAIAGPSVLHTLLTGRALDRLYLTTACKLLGGEEFDTFNSGSTLSPAVSMPLNALYYDRQALDGSGQLFAVYGA